MFMTDMQIDTHMYMGHQNHPMHIRISDKYVHCTDSWF